MPGRATGKDPGRLHLSDKSSRGIYLSYLRIAWRNLVRDQSISLINAASLAVSMSVGLLAMGAYLDRTEVDNFHVNRENIYRIVTNVNDGKSKETYASTPSPLAERIRTEVVGVAKVTEVDKDVVADVIQGPNFSIPFKAYYADENFPEVFSFPLAEGDITEALVKPFTVIITESAAGKLFRDGSSLGKVLDLKGLGRFEVTGVIKDYPRSHFDFEMLISHSTMSAVTDQIGFNTNDWTDLKKHYTYVLLAPNALSSDIERSIATLNIPELERSRVKISFEVQHMKDIPGTELVNGIGLLWGDSGYVVLLMLTALVLLPACFNYSNITIARALRRAKEIGIRKVSGGKSTHIFWQMVMETVIISFISLIVSMLIFVLVRDEFIALVSNGQKKFDLDLTPLTVFTFVAFSIFVGILAGILPAAYFSRMNPIETLRNSSLGGKLSKTSIRKGLIVFQFALTLTFILSVVMIRKQYSYVLGFDPGSGNEDVVQVSLKDADVSLVESEFSRLPGVKSVSMSSSMHGKWSQESLWVRNGDDSTVVFQIFADAKYIDELNFEIIAGSNFSSQGAINKTSIIVNETFVKEFRLGSPRDAIDQTVMIDSAERRIIGVTKDFNFMPLQKVMHSFIFRTDPQFYRYANVTFVANEDQTILQLSEAWKRISPHPFEYELMAVQMDETFRPYRSMVQVCSFLGFISIVISCLGLFAVVASIVESRTREIGVRKLFGARIYDLATVTIGSLLILILIAIMIATPLTYYFFDQIFVRQFYFQVTIAFQEIAISILFLLLLISTIIGFQVAKISRVNPVETLKYE